MLLPSYLLIPSLTQIMLPVIIPSLTVKALPLVRDLGIIVQVSCVLTYKRYTVADSFLLGS